MNKVGAGKSASKKTTVPVKGLGKLVGEILEVVPDSNNYKIPFRKGKISGLSVLQFTLEHTFNDKGADDVAKHLYYDLFVDKGVAELKENHGKAAKDLKDNPDRIIKAANRVLDEFLLPMINKGRLRRTAARSGGTATGRDKDFRELLVERDSPPVCAVTGLPDRKHPAPPLGMLPVRLQGAHIIPRSACDNAGLQTFIHKFTGKNIDQIIDHDLADSAYNGMLLQVDAHKDFDSYAWGINYSATTKKYTAVKISKGDHDLSFNIGLNGREMIFRDGTNAKPDPLLCRLHFSVGTILAETRMTALAIDDPNGA